MKNPTQDTWFATRDGQALTRAIAAADPGDRLNVFGTCRGNYVIGKDLRVFGNPQATAPTVLDGRGSGRVLTVSPTCSPRTRRGSPATPPAGAAAGSSTRAWPC